VAFQSYDELIKMASTNPKRASGYVREAQNSGRPVVSADNPGYSDDPRSEAIKRSMKKKMMASSPQDKTIEQRKELGY